MKQDQPSVSPNPRPILRWAGAKTQILDKLARFWTNPDSLYVEPFCGSASLYLRLAPKHAILGDLNSDLIDAYRMVRRAPEQVHRALSEWERSKEEYYRVRAMEPKQLSKAQRAARFVYLNRLCFNGLYRTNLKGEFNVPWGAERSGQLPTVDQFRAFARRLSGVKLVSRDFDETLKLATPGSFVYLDPPYRVSKARVFREYMPSGFGVGDVARIRQAIVDLDLRGVRFLLSYAESDEARALAIGFACTVVPVKRYIAGASDKRGAAREMLISNIQDVS